MEEQKDFEKEMAKKLKQKKIRKYALIVLVLAAVVYAASIFTIEDKDALLADGQGNVIDYRQEADDQNTEAEQQAEEEDTEQQNGEASDPDKQDD
ncbi:MAG: hypothetical protein IJ443_06855, partial [Firmicutes bacterium]|nr:hypothetical protein [Bacillota bacterium]